MANDPDPLADDPDLSADELPQASSFFTKPTEPDVRLDPDHPAFDRVQGGTADAAEAEIARENEREYNRRYVREHGDHHGHTPTKAD